MMFKVLHVSAAPSSRAHVCLVSVANAVVVAGLTLPQPVLHAEMLSGRVGFTADLAVCCMLLQKGAADVHR